MRYAESFGRKNWGHSRTALAEECRRSALDFMAGVADGWTKFDLALWLRGPYALATSHTPRGDRSTLDREPTPIGKKTVEQLVVNARAQVLAALELAVLVGGTPDFIEDALIEQHVRRGVDAHGETAWVPVDGAHMKLTERVASLFVADYLNRPRDYVDLYVCHLCEGITFEPGAKERGRCGDHRISAVVSKSGTMERPVRTLAYGE